MPDFNEQKVLNRTEPNNGMKSFTITGAGSIRPSKSGGPFTDDRFRVAGMAQRGVRIQTGHDECLCIEIIDDLIAKYKTSLAPAAPVGAAGLAPTSASSTLIVVTPPLATTAPAALATDASASISQPPSPGAVESSPADA